jgi:hypothetical protein
VRGLPPFAQERQIGWYDTAKGVGRPHHGSLAALRALEQRPLPTHLRPPERKAVLTRKRTGRTQPKCKHFSSVVFCEMAVDFGKGETVAWTYGDLSGGRSARKPNWKAKISDAARYRA